MPQTPTDHARRRHTLRAALASHEPALDAVLVTNLDNVHYLAGFTGSNGALLVAADPARDAIATDGRYLTQVAEQSGDLRAVIERDVAKALLAGARGTVGFEATALFSPSMGMNTRLFMEKAMLLAASATSPSLPTSMTNQAKPTTSMKKLTPLGPP